MYLLTGMHKATDTVNSVPACLVNLPLVKCLIEIVNFSSVCACQQETLPAQWDTQLEVCCVCMCLTGDVMLLDIQLTGLRLQSDIASVMRL